MGASNSAEARTRANRNGGRNQQPERRFQPQENQIELSKGSVWLCAQLIDDQDVRFIALSNRPEKEERSVEVVLGLDQVDDLVQALRTLHAQATEAPPEGKRWRRSRRPE